VCHVGAARVLVLLLRVCMLRAGLCKDVGVGEACTHQFVVGRLTQLGCKAVTVGGPLPHVPLASPPPPQAAALRDKAKEMLQRMSVLLDGLGQFAARAPMGRAGRIQELIARAGACINNVIIY